MNFFVYVIKGVFIGIANIIPGVSGGTMAVSLGIYEKIIDSIANIPQKMQSSIKVLTPIVFGAFLGVAITSKMVKTALDTFTLGTCLLFVGLILGGLPILIEIFKNNIKAKLTKKVSKSDLFCFIGFLFVGVLLALAQDPIENTKHISLSFGFIFILVVLGFISSFTMIIPGISGSMVLLLIGYYSAILELVTSFIESILRMEWQILFETLFLLFPFGIGLLVGLATASNLIKTLLTKFPTQSYAAIIGLIFSSPFAILYTSGAFLNFNFAELVIGLFLGSFSAYITYRIGKSH